MGKNKLLFIHNGAMGDRLLTWPLLRALAASVYGSGDPSSARLWFLGPDHNPAWQKELGYGRPPVAVAKAVDGLYGGRVSEILQDLSIIWPVLERPPFAPPEGLTIHWLLSCPPMMADGSLGTEISGVSYRRGQPVIRKILPCHGGDDRSGACPAKRPPHVAYALLDQALRKGLLPPLDPEQEILRALEVFPKMYGAWEPLPGRISILPGAGGEAKRWPLARFAQVAARLEDAGCDVLWILGPAEQERGLVPPAGAIVSAPESLAELSSLLRSSHLVLANDSGPAHLAAMHGTPVLALFGPADPRRWCPLGGWVLHGSRLMDDLDVGTVYGALRECVLR